MGLTLKKPSELDTQTINAFRSILDIYTPERSIIAASGSMYLSGDENAPGNLKLYGTDASGVKGWHDQASLSGFVNASGTPVANQIAIWKDADTIEGSTELSYNGRTFIFGGYPIDVPDAGQTNLAIGSILNDYDSAEYNVFIGVDAGKTTQVEGYNVAIGYGAYASSLGGVANVAVGYMSLYSNLGDFSASGVEGIWNTAIGAETLFSNTIGGYNTAIGAHALYSNIENHNNTAIGSFALNILSGGEDNVAIGYDALGLSIDGNSNIAIGKEALGPLHGDENVMIGTNAGCGGSSSDSVNGIITIGTRAALHNSANFFGVHLCTDSIFIGRDVKPLVDNSNNEIVIGSEAIGLGSNTVVLGNSSIEKTGLHGYLILDEIEPPSGVTPASGTGFLYIDMSDSKLKFKDDGGSVYDLTT